MGWNDEYKIETKKKKSKATGRHWKKQPQELYCIVAGSAARKRIRGHRSAVLLPEGQIYVQPTQKRMHGKPKKRGSYIKTEKKLVITNLRGEGSGQGQHKGGGKKRKKGNERGPGGVGTEEIMS